MSDVEITTTKGSGPGGQNRNKVESEVIAKHIPTGIVIRYGSERSQYQNKQIAITLLQTRISQQTKDKNDKDINLQKKSQIGTGMRGDKIRTIRVQENMVKSHINGNTISYESYLKGNLL